MTSENIGRRLKDFLVSQNVICGAGVSENRIADFERRYNIRMPVDLKDYFMTMNGSAGDYCYGMIRFWSLDEVKSLAEEIHGKRLPNAAVIQATYLEPIKAAEQYFVFADFLHESQLYAIYLASSQFGPNQVILLDGSAPIRVADGFSHFVDLYMTSPEILRLSVD